MLVPRMAPMLALARWAADVLRHHLAEDVRSLASPESTGASATTITASITIEASIISSCFSCFS